MSSSVPPSVPSSSTTSSSSDDFFTVTFNTSALASLLRTMSDRMDRAEERARLFEERTVQLLDALTETSQRLTVSENQYAAVFDTVTTLTKAVHAMQADKLDAEVHENNVARIDGQLGELRLHLEMIDAKKQDIDVPALMKRVSQESRDTATKIIMERETESRRATEALLHDKLSKLNDEVKQRTEHVVADSHVQAQLTKRTVDEATTALLRRADTQDAKAQFTQVALENLVVKLRLTENNIDALSDVVKDDVADARQHVACVAHAFGVNVDALLSAVPVAERSQLSVEAASETNTIRAWKWERMEMLRRQCVVDGWAPLRVQTPEILRKVQVPANCVAAPDAEMALAKRDELVRNAARKRKEMMAEKAAQQQLQAAAAAAQHQKDSAATFSQSSPSSGAGDAAATSSLILSDAAKLFLASPMFVDLEMRAVSSLRSDLAVLKQKIISDSTLQIQQLDKVVRQKIGFDQAKSLVNEAAGVASELACEPIKEQVESLKKQVLMREAALALLSDKVSRRELASEIAPSLADTAKALRLGFEMQMEASALAHKTSVEKHVAAIRDRCGTIEEHARESAKVVASLEADIRAVQLRAAASISRGGAAGDDGRCLSCGNVASNSNNNDNTGSVITAGAGRPARPSSAAARAAAAATSATPPQQPLAAPASGSGSNPTHLVPHHDIPSYTATNHQAVADGPSVQVLVSSVDDTTDRKKHQGLMTGAGSSSLSSSSSGNKTGVAVNVADARRPLEPAPPAAAAAAAAMPGTAAFLKQQKFNGSTSTVAPLHAHPASPHPAAAAAPAANWMQHLDDAFQLRSLHPPQHIPAPDQQQQAPAAAMAIAPASATGSRPTSARNRPSGAWNSMNK